MTPEKVIVDLEDQLSEWLEMSEDPTTTMLWALASKYVEQKGYIEYLERSLHANR